MNYDQTEPKKIETDNEIVYVSNMIYYHRLNGPARIGKLTGIEEYYVNGRRHRFDGPAIVYTDHGIKGSELWYINGFYVEHLIRPWAKEMNIDLDNLTEEDVAMIVVKWGDYDDPTVENKHQAKHYIMRN